MEHFSELPFKIRTKVLVHFSDSKRVQCPQQRTGMLSLQAEGQPFGPVTGLHRKLAVDWPSLSSCR